MTVLLLTETDDTSATLVQHHLARYGADAFIFSTRDFPLSSDITLALDAEGHSCSLECGGIRHNLTSVGAVWYRLPLPPRTPTLMTPVHADFARRESVQLLRSIWHLMRNALWVNDWRAVLSADHKPYQLAMAAANGISVPRTIITNNPNDAMTFFRECGGRAIYKTITPYELLTARDGNGCPPFIFTNLVSEEHLTAHNDRIRYAPCLFQEYIDKCVELRVTIVGSDIFSMEIHSQDHTSSTIDWRCATDPDALEYSACELPEAITHKLLTLMRSLGLLFGCVDMILTPNGEYVFLEVNPNGQWYWVEEKTGLPIASSIARLLARGA